MTTTTLHYGKTTTCLLDSAEATRLRPQQKKSLPLDQIAAAVRTQLGEPLHFPPLSQATIPGDRVVLAIAADIPERLAVIEGALQGLRDAGVEDDLITLLQASPSSNAETLQAELATLGFSQCQVKVHDPNNEKESAFLGVTQKGQALRLNRELCDADLVLPVTVTTGELRGHASLSSFEGSSFDGLFPAFSDRETIERFAATTAKHFPATCPESRQESEACGRQLGIGITIQVVPGSGGQVAAVLVGDPASVAQQAQTKYQQAWSCTTHQRGNLVIAAITGSAEQQTWQSVSRALAAAETVLEPGGSIAICSELAEPPGLALSQLFGNDDYHVVAREILQNPSADSGPAMQLCRALERGSVYLRSRLNATVVESLGITPLESDSELEHLAQTLRPCLVLEEAQRLLPSLIEVEA